jgi:hypothetical protein
MKDLGPLHHFLGITVERHPDGMFLHRRTYTLDIIKRAAMADCKPCTTPVDLQAKLAVDSGPPVQDASQFRSIAGVLQYLTFTRPDIAYAVQQICLHMHDPREPHLMAMKRILRYLQWTPDYGLLLRRKSNSDLVVYTDADWVGCPDTRRSTSGYAVFLGDNLVSWSAKRQTVVSCSGAEGEYRAVGCVSCSTSYGPRRLGAHLSTVIISVSCTYPSTLFNINAPSMWRLIFILFERRLPLLGTELSLSSRGRMTLGVGEFFLVYFSHSTTMPCPSRGWRYILIGC